MAKFEVGHPYMGGSRKKESISQAILAGMAARWTPQSIMDDLDWCVEEGKRRGSPKAVLAATITKLEYMVGTPIQRVVTTTTGLEQVLAQLEGREELEEA